LKDFEEKILDVYFKSDEYLLIVDYFHHNCLTMVSLFKLLTYFFCLPLLTKCESEKKFFEAFKKLYDHCKIFPEMADYNYDDKYLIKEFVMLYIHIMTVHTHKAFLASGLSRELFQKTKNEFNSIFSQKNRDLLIENLFAIYDNDKTQFSFYSFIMENFKFLHHDRVVQSLKEIEGRNIKTKNGLTTH